MIPCQWSDGGPPLPCTPPESYWSETGSHRWIDLDEDPVGRLLRDGPIGKRSLPVVFFANGEVLEGPPSYVEPFAGEVRASAAEDYVASASWLTELARGAGLDCRPQREEYDVVVLGAGPAGLTAAVYTSSSSSG